MKASDAHHGHAQGSTMTLDRMRHTSCPACGAPGQYQSAAITRDGYSEAQIAEMLALRPDMAAMAEHFRKGWPGCYVEMGDPRDHQPVGETCPNCGADRALPQKLEPMQIKGRLAP